VTFVVIGSGPAGVAAARALCGAGRRIVMLDAGDTIEAARMDVFDALAHSEPSSWSPQLAAQARGTFPVTLRNVPLKPSYGSLFPYALDDADLPVIRENAETLPSLALGGLSNAWGASMLPARQRDIAEWPITLEELAPHYEAVLRFVPIAAERDELSRSLPLYTDSPGELRRGLQSEMILSHMRRHTGALAAAGYTFGASRLAVVTSPGHQSSCRHCGMCLYGCPYQAIYNASHTLEPLVRECRVEYRGGVYVDRLELAEHSVMVHVHERGHPSAAAQIDASRVFVACGALSSTRLMLDSIERPPRARRLLDSQYFVIPLITPRAVPVSVATQGNTLAQVFLELDDERVARHTVHLQIYGYNDLMLSALAARLPLSADRLERLLQPLLGRLVVMQGYLHSEDSPGLTLHMDGKGARVVGDDDATSATGVKRIVRRLALSARLLGMVPMPGLAQAGRPGKGNHLGGSFPMRSSPEELTTDTLGRLPRWDRVHLVDASVLPSVPASTVTLSVMANAHRIASAAAAIGD